MKIQGEIQNIRKNKKGVQINNIWYSSFKELNFKKGDIVIIEYKVNKNFRNIKSIEKLEETKNTNKEKELSETQKNCLVMTAKDLAIGKNIDIEEALKRVKKAYNLI